MNALNFYRQQSNISNPGLYGEYFNDLPCCIAELCEIVQGLIFHYAEEHLYHYQIANHRFNECHLRSAEKILGRLIELKSGPFTQKRTYEERVVGVCRDNALLMCSIMRHKNVPARVRVGFANYIIPSLYVDGMCLEVWNSIKNKWCAVDTRTNDTQIQKLNLSIDFDLMDLPESKYCGAAHAWYLCRNSVLKENRFGYGIYRGLWTIRNRMLQDLAALNKDEVLLWDYWGLMSGYNDNFRKISDKQLIQLDELSRVIRAYENSENCQQLWSLAEEFL